MSDSLNNSDRHFLKQLEEFSAACPDLHVFEERRIDGGGHPANFVDYECAFAAYHLAALRPGRILDIGSYRHFILGLLAAYPVTTVDVRKRTSASPLETAVTCSAESMPFDDDFFDAVTSLCAVEHFGLGRYGDPFSIDGDVKTFNEMKRVLKPGGHLILTTTFTAGRPAVAFNAHRIYSHSQITSLLGGFSPVEEKIYSHNHRDFRPLAEAVSTPRGWDVYCGCWSKEQS